MLTTKNATIRRDAWVEIDLSALVYNVKEIKSWLSAKTRLMAVVKADAYGHGASDLAPILEASGVNYLGVAAVDEGCQLRASGVKLPILILSPSPTWAVSNALQYDLEFSVTSLNQIKDLSYQSAKLGLVAKIHLKVDTGMHRLGLAPQEVAEALSLISASPALSLLGISSHLSCPDNEKLVMRQNQVFAQVVQMAKECGIKPIFHLASGEAARRFPDTHYDMVRAGLYMYGLEPKVVSQIVRPALSVRARINQLKYIEAGESCGYGQMWIAQRKTRLASVPLGYADGVDRRLSNKLLGLLNGLKVQQVGLISMDQMLFDVTDCQSIAEGDVITLIGSELGGKKEGKPETLHLASWAEILDTITYELVCRLRARLPRIYTRS